MLPGTRIFSGSTNMLQLTYLDRLTGLKAIVVDFNCGLALLAQTAAVTYTSKSRKTMFHRPRCPPTLISCRTSVASITVGAPAPGGTDLLSAFQSHRVRSRIFAFAAD